MFEAFARAYARIALFLIENCVSDIICAAVVYRVHSTLYMSPLRARVESGDRQDAGTCALFWLALLLFGFISILQMYVILDG